MLRHFFDKCRTETKKKTILNTKIGIHLLQQVNRLKLVINYSHIHFLSSDIIIRHEKILEIPRFLEIPTPGGVIAQPRLGHAAIAAIKNHRGILRERSRGLCASIFF